MQSSHSAMFRLLFVSFCMMLLDIVEVANAGWGVSLPAAPTIKPPTVKPPTVKTPHVPHSPVNLDVKPPSDGLKAPTPTGPIYKYILRPAGLPEGAPWNDMRKIPRPNTEGVKKRSSEKWERGRRWTEKNWPGKGNGSPYGEEGTSGNESNGGDGGGGDSTRVGGLSGN